eukprot:3109224-Amphidinium_carterae.2
MRGPVWCPLVTGRCKQIPFDAFHMKAKLHAGGLCMLRVVDLLQAIGLPRRTITTLYVKGSPRDQEIENNVRRNMASD